RGWRRGTTRAALRLAASTTRPAAASFTALRDTAHWSGELPAAQSLASVAVAVDGGRSAVRARDLDQHDRPRASAVARAGVSGADLEWLVRAVSRDRLAGAPRADGAADLARGDGAHAGGAGDRADPLGVVGDVAGRDAAVRQDADVRLRRRLRGDRAL